MSTPLVSVITPTWHRADLLVKRCIPSVQAQTHANIEHIIVSDGPDPLLREYMQQAMINRTWVRDLYYAELPGHAPEPHWGTEARLFGIEYANGDLIAYCDDDDSFRPRHCELLAAALADHPGAGFAVSCLGSHGPFGLHEVGYGQIALGNVGTPMIMHRRETLEHGTWGEPGPYEDWDLVLQWLNADVPYVQVDEITCDAWPSAYGSKL